MAGGDRGRAILRLPDAVKSRDDDILGNRDAVTLQFIAGSNRRSIIHTYNRIGHLFSFYEGIYHIPDRPEPIVAITKHIICKKRYRFLAVPF